MALCGFLQEAAERDAHARGAGMDLLRARGLGWMLVRLVIEVAAWPAEQEEVTVSTWPTGFGGATAERHFRVVSLQGRRLAEASSRWAVVDLAARRVVRVPEDIRRLPIVPKRVPVSLDLLPSFPEEALVLGERTIEVCPADLDALGHANHVRFLEWALGALPEGFDHGREIARLDLAFKREARQGDRLRTRAVLVEEDAVAHELRPDAGGETCVLALTRWRPDPRQIEVSRGGRGVPLR